jgi:tellurite methyltransferase
MNAPSLKRDWDAYYKAVKKRPPRKTILTALAAFESPGFAIDLGCGIGRDTIAILQQNCTVLAIDKSPEASAQLQTDLGEFTPQLQTQISRFEDLEITQTGDLINASFCLPFCTPQVFPHLWQQIVNNLKPGGRFCGHLFGDRDSWGETELIHSLSRPQVETLLKPFTIELLDEEEHPGKTPLGEDRDWHIFHIVARKL